MRLRSMPAMVLRMSASASHCGRLNCRIMAFMNMDWVSVEIIIGSL